MKKTQTRQDRDRLDGTVMPTDDSAVVVWLGASIGERSIKTSAHGRAPNESHVGRALAMALLCLFCWVPTCSTAAMLQWTVGIAWVTVVMSCLMLIATVAGVYFVMRQKPAKGEGQSSRRGVPGEGVGVIEFGVPEQLVRNPAESTTPVAAAPEPSAPPDHTTA